MATTVPQLRGALKRSSPGLRYERGLWESGAGLIAGMDEVGKGAWAGPLAVGAAIVPRDRRIYKVRDSKLLSEKEREAMFDRIAGWCHAWAVGMASHRECDELGMSAAQRLAARRALDGLDCEADRLLLDGNWDFVADGRSTMIVGGDRASLSIAAASILAKVVRDRYMRQQCELYPWFHFSDNKGYPCPRHRAALHHWGPSTIHRESWAFMDGLAWRGVRRIIPDHGQEPLSL